MLSSTLKQIYNTSVAVIGKNNGAIGIFEWAVMLDVYTEEGIKIIRKYVMMKLKNPCINLNDIYLLIFISVFPINDRTWAIIASPEKEHKKLMRLNFKFNGMEIEDNILHPFVISTDPNITEYKALDGMLKKCSIFCISTVKYGLVFIKDIITEKIIINPPMFKTVVIEFSTEFFNAIPILDLDWWYIFFEELEFLIVSFFCVNIPINIHDI